MSKKRVRRATERKAESTDPLTRKNNPLFRAACAIVARKYCDWFASWRDCRYKPCRGARRCLGDVGPCLKKCTDNASYETRVAARRRMPDDVPPNADRWLRLAHDWPPETLLLPKTNARTNGKTNEKTSSSGKLEAQNIAPADRNNDVGS